MANKVPPFPLVQNLVSLQEKLATGVRLLYLDMTHDPFSQHILKNLPMFQDGVGETALLVVPNES